MNSLLFASTPRAGEWNHRFLVPMGGTWSDAELEQLTRDDSPYVVRESNRVKQGGERGGVEMLVLVDDRLDDSNRANVKSWLREKLPELGRIVSESIDWNGWPGDPPLVVPCKQLNPLQLEANTLLASFAKKPLKPERPRQLPSVSVARIAFGTILLLCLGLVVWTQRFGVPRRGEARPVAVSEELPKAEVRRIRELATLVAFGLHERIADTTCKELAEHLEKQLFGGPIRMDTSLQNEVSKTDNSSKEVSVPKSRRKSIAIHPSGRERLSIVCMTLCEIDGIQNVDWLNDRALDVRIEKLFPKPRFALDPYGLITPPFAPKTVSQKGMTPPILWPMIERLQALHDAVQEVELPKDADPYDTFFAQVKKLDLNLPVMRPETSKAFAKRRFFVNGDVMFVERFVTLMTSDVAIRLYSETPGPTGLIEILSTVANTKKSRLHNDVLIRRRDDNKDNKKGPAFEKLNHFVKACQSASTQLESAKSSATAQ